MELIKSIRQFLKGKKTYLVSAAGVLTVIVSWSSGELSTHEAIVSGLTALGFIPLRASIRRDDI